MIRELLLLLFFATLGTCTLMGLLWLVQRRTGNAGIVDVAWAGSLAAMSLFYAAAGPGWEVRKVLIAIMAVLWGVRLSWHIHARGKGKPEDGRYQQLRKEWAPHVQFRMFRFFQFQAAAAVFFSLPFLLPALNQHPVLHPLERAAFVLWCIAFAGEALADLQLNWHKRDSSRRGQTCRQGLWRYSRHPNYFFEWLIWVSFALFSLASPWGWLSLACPALIFYFLFNVTGIPATEAQALRTRGDDYRDYQKTTSAFFPWFPRKPS